jgi:Glycosyl transferase family 2
MRSVLETARAWAGAGVRPPHSDKKESLEDRGARSLGLVQNSLALIAAKVGIMGLGFVFWLVAAREFDARAVGLAAGAVSAVMLCTQIALLGIGSAFITYLREHRREPARLVDTSITMVSIASVLGALIGRSTDPASRPSCRTRRRPNLLASRRLGTRFHRRRATSVPARAQRARHRTGGLQAILTPCPAIPLQTGRAVRRRGHRVREPCRSRTPDRGCGRHPAKTAVGSTVTVLENQQRQGLSGARNTGTTAARGEIVAFLDDDCEAAPHLRAYSNR